jgi:ABC-type phosphate transport system substrate-binding protein
MTKPISKTDRIRCTLLLAAAALVAVPAGAPHADQGGLIVIVHKDNPQAALNAEEARTYFLKKSSAWPSGEKIRPVDVDGDPALRAAFLAKVLHMSAQDLERHWLEIKYQAAESPPKRVDDAEGVIRYVGAFKGAIGFLPAASADALKDKPVRIAFRL